MVEVFLHDNLDNASNFTDEHNSGVEVTIDELKSLGVFYKYITSIEDLNEIATDRQYKNRDEVKLSVATFNNDEEALNAKLTQFYEEHFHEDEEIRYIVDGEGYFDVRDKNDRWIRAKLSKYDLLILPAGIYHRFTLTNDKYVHAVRLFKDEPKWEAINRAANIHTAARTDYVNSIA
jgi:1,2-dihydroxy-3-keto-5-methylthiopentene dioxygenase